MERTLIKLTYIIAALLFLWLGVSYIEIICKNITNPVYSNLNLISLLIKYFV